MNWTTQDIKFRKAATSKSKAPKKKKKIEEPKNKEVENEEITTKNDVSFLKSCISKWESIENFHFCVSQYFDHCIKIFTFDMEL